MRMRWTPPLMLAIGLFALPALAANQHKPMQPSHASMPAARQTVVGQVVSVDAAGRAVTVKEGNTEMRYTLAPTALVESGGKTVSLDAVKAGEQVRLTVQKDSTSASRLEVVPATPHPKKS